MCVGLYSPNGDTNIRSHRDKGPPTSPGDLTTKPSRVAAPPPACSFPMFETATKTHDCNSYVTACNNCVGINYKCAADADSTVKSNREESYCNLATPICGQCNPPSCTGPWDSSLCINRDTYDGLCGVVWKKDEIVIPKGKTFANLTAKRVFYVTDLSKWTSLGTYPISSAMGDVAPPGQKAGYVMKNYFTKSKSFSIQAMSPEVPGGGATWSTQIAVNEPFTLDTVYVGMIPDALGTFAAFPVSVNIIMNGDAVDPVHGGCFAPYPNSLSIPRSVLKEDSFWQNPDAPGDFFTGALFAFSFSGRLDATIKQVPYWPGAVLWECDLTMNVWSRNINEIFRGGGTSAPQVYAPNTL